MASTNTSPPASVEPLRQSEERFRLLVAGVKDYAIFMLDPAGRVVTWNAGASRIKGYAEAEIVGRHFSVFYPPEALSRNVPAFELQSAERLGSFEDEGWRVRKDGTLFWANVVITALRRADGDLIGFSKITRDLTLRRESEETLRQSEERFRLLIEGVDEYAIFMLDPNGIVATWNSGAERIKGYAASEIVGKHFSIFYPPEVKESGWPEHELRVAAEVGRFVDEGIRIRKDGSTFFAGVTITSLRGSHGQLLGFAKLTRDLSERQRTEKLELEGKEREAILEAERSARMAAQRATRIKDEFLATLSHELRTPLSVIRGWTQRLQRDLESLPLAELKRAVEVIDRNARAQVALIDDLLDLSRIMTGKLRLDQTVLDLREVVNRAAESAEPAARAKSIRLEVTLDTAPSPVEADGARLQQVFWNLLSNAIKFTPNGGQIAVGLRQIDSQIEVSVRDTGIGIPRQYLPYVFERFSQRDSSMSRSYGGLGLGLAIAKQLVELHSGQIRAESAGEDQGSTFFVDLPIAAARLTKEDGAAASSDVEVLGDGEVIPRLSGVHVFVIDDEDDARDLLKQILEDHAAGVTAFASGEEALASLATVKPSVIVSDIGMPRMDGFQFMRSFRAIEARGERVPALALTAFARAADRKNALLAGYQAHLAKPFDVSELILVVAGLVSR